MRRVFEGTMATVAGGAILWCVTNPASRSLSFSSTLPPVERQTEKAVYSGPTIQAVGEPSGLPPPTMPTSEAAVPPPATNVLPPPTAPPAMNVLPPATPQLAVNASPAAPPFGSVMPIAPPMRPAPVYSISVGTILLYENFARYREGMATDWGANTTAKMGPDGHQWLAAFVEGTYPVGRNFRLPNEFYWECRYAVQMPEVTRGVLGWWKDPLASRVVPVGVCEAF